MKEELHALRPLSVLDLFDEAFSLYRSNFLLMAGVTGLVYIPLDILTKLIDLSASNTALATLPFVLIITMVAFAFVQGALTKVVAERYLGHKISIAGAYGFVQQRFFPFLGTFILVALAFLVGFITLVGWIIVFLWFSFVFPVLVVEDQVYASAMRRSRELAKHNWGRIFLVNLITALLSVIIDAGVMGLVLLIFRALPTGLNAVLAGTLQGITEALVLPISLIPFVLLYFDLRVRKEGYDLELLAQEMAARAGGLSNQ